ncbi:hypothetical protein ABJI51_09985 [Amycolatopsis sp. NEAU-NG30]|uniref:Uncharacterized protein n=1 Tax=Amycolatopsis melonis TaxID=3156488 RepID=A0ABV0LAU3_9PSEU
MPPSDRATADAHAAAARQAIEQGRNSANPISLATAEALLAVFHQLKHMDDHSVASDQVSTLIGAIDTLTYKLPDH